VAVLIGVILLGRYSFIAFWLYNRIIAAKPNSIRHFYGALAFAGAIAVFAVNIFFAVPPAPQIPRLVKDIKESMIQGLLPQQNNQTADATDTTKEPRNNDSGGFRYAQNGGPHDAQVWTTAQVLYALEMAKPAVPDAPAIIRRGLEYVERMRIPVVNGPCQLPNGQQDGWGYTKFIPWGVTEINSWVLLSKNCVAPSAYPDARLE